MTVQHFHIGQRLQILLQDEGTPQLIPSMDKIHLLASAGQIGRIFQSHVSAAYHGHGLSPEKGSVAGSAVGHALSGKPFLTGHAQLRMDGAGSQYHGSRLQRPVIRHHRLCIPIVLNGTDTCLRKLHPQLIRMVPELHAHVKAVDARHPQIIVYLIGVEHLPAAHRRLFHHQQIKPCPLSIYGRRKPRRPGPNDDQIVHTLLRSFSAIADSATIA